MRNAVMERRRRFRFRFLMRSTSPKKKFVLISTLLPGDESSCRFINNNIPQTQSRRPFANIFSNPSFSNPLLPHSTPTLHSRQSHSTSHTGQSRSRLPRSIECRCKSLSHPACYSYFPCLGIYLLTMV